MKKTLILVFMMLAIINSSALMKQVYSNPAQISNIQTNRSTLNIPDPNIVKASVSDSSLSRASQKLVSIPSGVDRFYLSGDDEAIVLQRCISVFEHSNRHDLIEKWQNATLGCAFLEYNILQREIQWIASVQSDGHCVGTLALEINGDLGWVSPNDGFSLEESLEMAKSSLANYTNSEISGLKLMTFGGKHYWFLNASSTAYLVDVSSGSVTIKRMDELLSSATVFQPSPPGAHGNTEIQPRTVPYFNQGARWWCCPYSTTMVLGWWGLSQAINNHDQCAYDIARVGQGKDPPNTNDGVFVGCASYAVGQLYGYLSRWHGQMKSVWSCNDYTNNIDDLESDLYSGYIVAIEVDCDGSPSTTNDLHICVLIGYDNNDNFIWVNDPSGAWTWGGGDTYASYTNLESKWGAWDNNWPLAGFPDKDAPSDWLPHYHKHLGMVLYPGDWVLTKPTCSLTAPPGTITDRDTVTLTASLSCSDQNAGYSGLHIRVTGGNIISYSSSYFTGHPYDTNANPVSLPAPVVEFDRTSLSTGTTYTATVTIKPTALGSMNIYYRGWANDLNDVVHCNYDFNNVNPWQTLLHTTTVYDDRSSTPISMPRVEPWTQRDPADWADDRYAGSYKFTWYSCKSYAVTVNDDDTSGPTYSNLVTSPSPVPDTYSGSIRMQGDVTDPRGIYSVYFGYGYHGVIDYWYSPSGSSGATYWYDIPRSEWIQHVGNTIVWRIHAYDNDNDLPNDRADSYSAWGPNVQIVDTTPPSTPSPDDGVSGWSKVNTPTFSWSASSDSASGVKGYWWKVDGSSETWTTSTSVTLPPQSDGSHIFYVRAEDNAGNKGNYGQHGFQIDTIAPTGSITINNGAAYTNSTSVTLTLTYSDTGSGVDKVRYSNDGIWDTEPWEDPSSTKAWTLTSGDGTKTVYYQVEDKVGLASPTFSSTIILDTTAPVVAIAFPTNGAYLDSVVVVWVNGTVTELNKGTAQPLINDTRFTLTYWSSGVFGFSNNTAIPDSLVALKVSFTDLAGNNGSTTVTFTVDTVPPIVVIAYPTNGQYLNTATIWINGTVTELNKGSLEPHINNTVFSLISWDPSTGIFAFKNNTAMPDGTVFLTVNFTDLAGKTGYATVTFNLTPPVVNAYLVVRGLDNRIYYRLYNCSSKTWNPWMVLSSGATCDSPSAALCSNELHIVVRGMDGYTLWHGYVNLTDNTFSGWTWLSGWTPSAPTLASNGTVLCLVVRGGDNRIYYRVYSFSPRGWGSWNVLSKGVTCDGPAAAMLGDKLHIVVRGFSATEVYGNYSLWHVIVNPGLGVARDWVSISGYTSSKPTLAANQTANKLYLAVRGLDDRIYWRTYDAPATDAWGSWNVLPTGSTCDGPAVTAADNKLNFVVRGSDGSTLWHRYYDFSTATYSDWTKLSGLTPSPPTLTS